MMWNYNNSQVSAPIGINMGLQALGNCNKRNREEYLKDEDLVPSKMLKMEDMWDQEDYYSSDEGSKCYQYSPNASPCSTPPHSSAENTTFYGTPSCSPPYNNSNSCWQVNFVASSTGPRFQRSRYHYNLNNHSSSLGSGGNCPQSLQNSPAYRPNVQVPSSQQTIKCDENGKSYLDLGSGTPCSASRCCDPRNRWCPCGPACYRQRRLTVLNISMCKLGRYRQFSDPSLYKSVLICNTLRFIEREMENEGYFLNSHHQHHQNIINIPSSVSTTSSSHSSSVASAATTSATTTAVPAFSTFNSTPSSFITLEPSPPEPPRVPTPYPQYAFSSSDEDTDSGLGDDNKSINWGSVLSLSSQSDLDPLNNNDSIAELDSNPDFQDVDLSRSCKLTSLSIDDISKAVPEEQSLNRLQELDNVTKLLKFS